MNRSAVIYKAGQRHLGLTIVLRGEIEVFEERDGTEEILATTPERDFIDDVSMLLGTSTLATGRVISPDAEILHAPAIELRGALAEIPDVKNDHRCLDYTTPAGQPGSQIRWNACP